MNTASTAHRSDHLISGVIPEGTPITFKPFESPVSDLDVYVVRKGNLWWQARIVHRDGDSKTGLYGVLVTARTDDGRLVCYEPAAYIFGRSLAGTGLALSREASLVAQAHEPRALERAASGAALRVARAYTHLNRSVSEHPVIVNDARSAPPRPGFAPSLGESIGGRRIVYSSPRYTRSAPAPKPKTPDLSADVAKTIEAEVRDLNND